MNKKAITVILAAAAALSMSMASFAATWQNSDVGWWYQNDDGTYFANTWQWIDGNGDGTAESYYFDSNGYLLADATTPDGYTVNSDGAWIENGTIQQRTTLPEDPRQLYIAATVKTAQLGSMEADANVNMSMSIDGQTMDMSTIMNMKYKDLNTSSMKYLATTKSKALDYESEGIAFYTNGYYYLNMDGKKAKTPIDMDGMIAEIKKSTSMSPTDYIYMKDFQMATDENGNKVISYTVDSTELIDTMMSMYELLGMDMAKYDIAIRDMSGIAIVTPDGYCKGESTKMTMDMTVEGSSTSTTMSMDIQYKNPGQPVDFSLPSTEEYIEI